MSRQNEKEKKVPIRYTSRDFNTIKTDLVEYAKRYYPDTYQDFSEASFGSLMLDTVAYVGDMLSYYLDYQANESFLDTSIEVKNIIKLSKQLGYKQKGAPSSTGIVTFYASIPASSEGIGADLNYAPVLRRGAIFTSNGGASYTLADDVDFSNFQNEMVVSQVDSTTGSPTRYALRTYGRVVSGKLAIQKIQVGNFQRYPRFKIDSSNVSEIISITDSQGRVFYEVDNLAQDVIYKQILNMESDKNQVPFLIKPVSVSRRYIIEHEYGETFIQFGHGDENSSTKNDVIDTTKLALDMHGRDYITDKAFDPSKLISTDKMGIAPSNTTLTVVYRTNTANNVNASTNSLTNIANQEFSFSNPASLSAREIDNVVNSVEFINETPITGGDRINSTDDIKNLAYGSFSSQNRAVTREDYVTLAYMMPAQFGSLSKVQVIRDNSSFRRNLNIHVLSKDKEGSYTIAPQSIKNNLKSWLSRYKMINDTVDILDTKIINLGIEFTVVGENGFNKNQTLQLCVSKIINEFVNRNTEIGESLRIGDIFRVLKNVDSVLDVVEVKFVNKFGSQYSSISYDVLQNSSADGRLLEAPEDGIFEFKFPSSDIVGTVL